MPKDGDIFVLTIGKKNFIVETVVSAEARKQGLSGQLQLPNGYGMLFVYSTPAKHSMWMIKMKFPLDIIWLDEEMKIVNIAKGCNPCISECISYSSKYKVKYAIEMTAGNADAYGFKIGKHISVL